MHTKSYHPWGEESDFVCLCAGYHVCVYAHTMCLISAHSQTMYTYLVLVLLVMLSIADCTFSL